MIAPLSLWSILLYIFSMKKLYIDTLDALSTLVHDDVIQVAHAHDGWVRIGVPGGRSVAPLIKGILSCPQETLARIRLYLVDERLSGDTNSDTLLNVGLKDAFAKELLVPDQLIVPRQDHSFIEDGGQLDLLFLGVGEDGHVASLFPGSYPGLDARKIPEVTCVENSPKPPAERVTVTYRGLRKVAKRAKTYLLFLGEGKRNALERLLGGNEGASTLPCEFFPHEWFKVDIITDIQEMQP